jgi:hypothetical protein
MCAQGLGRIKADNKTRGYGRDGLRAKVGQDKGASGMANMIGVCARVRASRGGQKGYAKHNIEHVAQAVSARRAAQRELFLGWPRQRHAGEASMVGGAGGSEL